MISIVTKHFRTGKSPSSILRYSSETPTWFHGVKAFYDTMCRSSATDQFSMESLNLNAVAAAKDFFGEEHIPIGSIYGVESGSSEAPFKYGIKLLVHPKEDRHGQYVSIIMPWR